MIELTGKINALNIDFATGKTLLTLEINETEAVKHGYDELHDVEKLSIEIKKYRKKRSLDANAYCFVLIDKIAAKLSTTKEEVYRAAIKEIGGNSEVVCVQNSALEKLIEVWTSNGLGWQVDTFPSKIEDCTNVILYYGSSVYDTYQMSRLIENIVQDCKALGIETMTPAELSALVERWGDNGKMG